MDLQRMARSWHALTAVVVWAALIFQFILIVRGGVVLDETAPVPLATRLVRFISYFTVLTNILVAATATTLALGHDTTGKWWKVLRLNAIVGIAVTGLVHWFFLRPLMNLSGGDYVADKLLHVVAPLLAVIGWALFGPRGRADRSLLWPSLIYPVGWLIYTLLRGAIVDWYPYPFLDVNLHGYPRALLACAAVAVLLLALTWCVIRLDPRLPGAQGDANERRPASAG